MFAREEFNGAFRNVLESEVNRAEDYLRRGLPLTERVSPELRLDVALFARGGLAVLDSIRRIGYNVWKRRPVVSKARKLQLLVRSLWD